MNRTGQRGDQSVTAEDLIRGGDVAGALAELQGRIRQKPQDAKLRIFLFQLLCLTGDWKRAVTQLKLSAELDVAATPMAQAYREAIACELFREKVFEGAKEPLVFGEPAEWIAWLVEALKLNARGEHTHAADLRARAFEAAPSASGRLDGEPFEWISDADMRLGPVLEMVVNGRYFWVPFTSIRRMRFDPPTDLRDAVWMPVDVTWANEGAQVALIPTRYVGSTAAADPLRLARATEWRDIGADTWAGLGQRLLATDAGDRGIMDVRLFEIGEAASEDGAEPVAAEAGDGGDDG